MPHVQELLSLRGKTALITGATGHLGSAMAAALAEAGARVIVSSRDRERAEEVVERLPAEDGQRHRGIALDHMDETSVAEGFAKAVEMCGAVDVLINNGHAALAADWESVTADQFSQHLTNATGYFLLARHFRNHVVARQGRGSVILLASMYGLVGSYPDAYAGVCPASPVAYHTLKGGILQMTRHLSVYWARDGVRVNALSPGPFPTDKAPGTMVERLAGKSPMGRMGEPSELKGPIVFLASDASSYMTGQNLVIDGGWTAW